MLLIEDSRLLKALEDRTDLIDARKTLAGVKKKKAKPLRTLMKELGFIQK